jgi:hypothetical protein
METSGVEFDPANLFAKSDDELKRMTLHELQQWLYDRCKVYRKKPGSLLLIRKYLEIAHFVNASAHPKASCYAYSDEQFQNIVTMATFAGQNRSHLHDALFRGAFVKDNNVLLRYSNSQIDELMTRFGKTFYRALKEERHAREQSKGLELAPFDPPRPSAQILVEETQQAAGQDDDETQAETADQGERAGAVTSDADAPPLTSSEELAEAKIQHSNKFGRDLRTCQNKKEILDTTRQMIASMPDHFRSDDQHVSRLLQKYFATRDLKTYSRAGNTRALGDEFFQSIIANVKKLPENATLEEMDEAWQYADFARAGNTNLVLTEIQKERLRQALKLYFNRIVHASAAASGTSVDAGNMDTERQAGVKQTERNARIQESLVSFKSALGACISYDQVGQTMKNQLELLKEKFGDDITEDDVRPFVHEYVNAGNIIQAKGKKNFRNFDQKLFSALQRKLVSEAPSSHEKIHMCWNFSSLKHPHPLMMDAGQAGLWALVLTPFFVKAMNSPATEETEDDGEDVEAAKDGPGEAPDNAPGLDFSDCRWSNEDETPSLIMQGLKDYFLRKIRSAQSWKNTHEFWEYFCNAYLTKVTEMNHRDVRTIMEQYVTTTLELLSCSHQPSSGQLPVNDGKEYTRKIADMMRQGTNIGNLHDIVFDPSKQVDYTVTETGRMYIAKWIACYLDLVRYVIADRRKSFENVLIAARTPNINWNMLTVAVYFNYINTRAKSLRNLYDNFASEFNQTFFRRENDIREPVFRAIWENYVKEGFLRDTNGKLTEEMLSKAENYSQQLMNDAVTRVKGLESNSTLGLVHQAIFRDIIDAKGKKCYKLPELMSLEPLSQAVFLKCTQMKYFHIHGQDPPAQASGAAHVAGPAAAASKEQLASKNVEQSKDKDDYARTEAECEDAAESVAPEIQKKSKCSRERAIPTSGVDADTELDPDEQPAEAQKRRKSSGKRRPAPVSESEAGGELESSKKAPRAKKQRRLPDDDDWLVEQSDGWYSRPSDARFPVSFFEKYGEALTAARKVVFDIEQELKAKRAEDRDGSE